MIAPDPPLGLDGDRIVGRFFLGPNHYSIGLQCADLVCAITVPPRVEAGKARGYLEVVMPHGLGTLR